MKTLLLSLLFACGSAASACADPFLPAIVTDGLSAYQKDGGRAAMAVWLKDSPAAADTRDVLDLEALLDEMATFRGKMAGYEVIKTVVFSPSSERVYLLLKLEKGPLYLALDCYRTPAGAWIIPLIGFNVRPEKVLPETLFPR